MKLPKQWFYWCRKAGLKPETKRGNYAGFYLKGRNRRWRADCNGNFVCSCPNEHFDRWANSRGAGVGHIPQSEAEFNAAVEYLLEQSKGKK